MTHSLIIAIKAAAAAGDTVTRNIALHSPAGHARITAALAILEAASATFNGRLNTPVWRKFCEVRDFYRHISAGQKRNAA